MILSFKEQFVEKILSGKKIHTIREDKTDRWQVGNKIQFATGVRTKNYNCFKEGECVSTQNFELQLIDLNDGFLDINFIIDGKSFNQLEFVLLLAKNDGFDSMNLFFDWFNKPFKGKIIHWTDFKY